MQFTADTHGSHTAKIYGHYNSSCNIRHYVGLPAGQPVMAEVVEVSEMKYMNMYFAYLCPNKYCLYTITSKEVLVMFTTRLLRLWCSIFNICSLLYTAF